MRPTGCTTPAEEPLNARIRVACLFGLHQNQAGEPTTGGTWFPDNEVNRREVKLTVESGNEACRSGTHCLEEREA